MEAAFPGAPTHPGGIRSGVRAWTWGTTAPRILLAMAAGTVPTGMPWVQPDTMRWEKDLAPCSLALQAFVLQQQGGRTCRSS